MGIFSHPIHYVKLAFLLTLVSISFSMASETSDTLGSGTVIVLPLKSQIDKTLLYLFRRGFQTAENQKNLKGIIIDMDTPGGRLKETEEIISWMRALSGKGIPIYSYVNTRAQSAGAIICLGSDEFFMAPGSRIGSAAPILMSPMGGVQEVGDDIKEKILSDTRALVRGLAQENGYLPELAMAMVDQEVEVKIGERIICPKGELLNLTAQEASEVIPPMEKPLLATAVVENLEELIALKGFSNCTITHIEPSGSESLARWLTLMAPFLMAAAFIGIYVEIKTPGFGVPGIIGIVCLIIFLFGHYIAGLAGKEDIFLVFIGVCLLAVEIFVLPGFGIAGILGVAALFAGMILTMIPKLPKLPKLPQDGFKQSALNHFLIMRS